MKLQDMILVGLMVFSIWAMGNVNDGEIHNAAIQTWEYVKDPNYVPTIDDLLVAESSLQQSILVRAALERWQQGAIADCLRGTPELRPILLHAFSKDRFYEPYMVSSVAHFEPYERYNKSLLNSKLKAEFAPELGLDKSVFYALLIDENVSVRSDSMKLLIWLDRQRNKVAPEVDSNVYHAWISALFDIALANVDEKTASEAIRYALKIKTSLSMETLEDICQQYGETRLTEAINLTQFSYEPEKAVDFLLRQSRNHPRRYDWILKQLEVILDGGQVSNAVLYEKIHKVLSREDIRAYEAEKLLPILKKCDRYKATDYMLSVILSDKSGEQLRKSDTLPSRAAYVLKETAVPEDIPQLVEAHKQRTNAWHFTLIGYALVKAGDDRCIPSVLEDYVLSDDKRIMSDIQKGTGSANEAVEVLRFALYQTKPEWAYELLEKGILDLNCHKWGSLKSIMVENSLAYGIPILEKRLQKESDPNNARKLRRAIERLRVKTKDEGRHLALENEDPYVVKMGLEAFAEKPDKNKLPDIIELTGSDDPVIAICAVKTLNRQPDKFFSVKGVEPELLRSVTLAYAGSKSLEECAKLIQQYHVNAEDLSKKTIRQCREMILSEEDGDVITAVQCLMKMPIEKGTRSMILCFISDEELHRFLLEHTRDIDSALAEAIRLCAPPEYDNIILPCITCGQFNLNPHMSKKLFPVLLKGMVLPANWYQGIDTHKRLTHLIELKPELVDKLIALSRDDDKEVAVSAAQYLMEVWPIIKNEKKRQYYDNCLDLSCSVKESYPKQTDEWIKFDYKARHGWLGFPRNVEIKTLSKHYLDGQLYGQPFAYKGGPEVRTGNIEVKTLQLGKHTCSMETYYEIKVGKEVVSGTIKLPQKHFSIE